MIACLEADGHARFVSGKARTYSKGVMVKHDAIVQVARQIGEAIDAERVVLFGSHARGNASDHSDVDLLVVAESDLPRFKRSRELYKLTKPHLFPMDLLVYTPDEVERGRKCSVSFVSAVLKEGKTVYVRGDGDRQTVGCEGEE